MPSKPLKFRLPFQIMPDDDLPQTICSNCAAKVQDAFTYKKMCEESDDKLRAYVRTRMDIDSKLFVEIHEEEDSPQIEKIHINDSMYNDLLDENQDDDFGSDEHYFEDDGGGNDHLSLSDIDENSADNSTTKRQTTKYSDGNGACVTKTQYRMGEDFQVLNNAKQVNGRYACDMCDKTLADRRTFLLHTRLHLGKNLKHCDICGKGKL